MKREAWQIYSWSLVILLLVLLVGLATLWLSLAAVRQVRIDVGTWGDHAVVQGVNGIEQAASENYRWTNGEATLVLPSLASGPQLLGLRLHGWRPGERAAPAVLLDHEGRPFGGFQTTADTRVYRLLLPPTNGLMAEIGLRSAGFRQPNDPRTLSVALDWATLNTLEQTHTPNLWQLGGQALLLGLLLALVGSLGLPVGWGLTLAVLLVTALPQANHIEPLWVGLALGPWIASVAFLLLASLLLGPPLRRMLHPWATPPQAQAAVALVIAALALRLAGSVHPFFDAHDVPVHIRWITTVARGELYLYSTPAELRNQQTFNPPAAYVLLLPLRLLLPSDRLTIQVGVALLDGLSCLLLLGIARELRLRAAAGLWALALSVALPISLTMLWWGFAANAMAQALWVPLLWALLRLIQCPTRLLATATSVLLAIGLLIHAGAMVLLATMLGLLIVIGWRRIPQEARRMLLWASGAAIGFVVLVYIAAAAGPVIEQEIDPEKRSLAATLAKGWADRELRFGLVTRGWMLGYLTPTLLLAGLGLPWVAAPRCNRHPLAGPLVGAWLIVSFGFFLAYMSLGLLVRYIYFAAPLVCLACGAMLATLARRPDGRVVATSLVLSVTLAGASLWLAGVLLRVKPSVVPLSH